MKLYGFQCEYCEGTVVERVADREPINHPRGIVVLENVPIGVCDRCGIVTAGRWPRSAAISAGVAHGAEQ